MMIWNLFLAHFLGDFVFQTEWLVRNRYKFWVLSIHGGIHLLLMLVLIGDARTILWPYIVIISLAHMLQDRIKVIVNQRKPEWLASSFIIDQLLHYSVLIVMLRWVQGMALPYKPIEKSPVIISALVLVLVSFVWFISERILNFKNLEYVENINKTRYSRMVARAGIVSLFIALRSWSVPALAFMVPNPYPESSYRRRAILVDLSVSILAIVFLLVVIR
jgi:hypothetical protein